MLVLKADLGIAGEMNRLGGVYRGNSGQTGIARRKARQFAQRRRFDLARRAQQVVDSRLGRLGKSDSWEVPMDHFDPQKPRLRPNYRDGSGNVVGKRMTGAATGVAKPKKMQPTRVAPRTAAAAVKIPKIGEPPIAPNLVGKSGRSGIGRKLLGPYRWEGVAHDARNAETNTRSLDSDDVRGEVERRRRVREARVIGGSGAAAFAGSRIGSRRKAKGVHFVIDTDKRSPSNPNGIVGVAAKRDRRYNPEDSRQRRLGGAAALAFGSGALLTHRGAQGVREATRISRRGVKFGPSAGRPAVILEEGGKKTRVIPVPERDRVRADDLHSRGITASRGDLARLGGGTALMGAGVGISRRGSSRSNREWR